MQFNRIFYIKSFTSLIAGGVLPFAFAPTHLWWLAFISPALLLICWLRSTPKQAFLFGLIFGIGLFSVGTSWVFISIHTFGNTSTFLAAIFTGLMILFLALYPAVQGYFLNYFFPRTNWSKLCLAFPSSWVLFEWLRSWLLTGFPWLFLGTSQAASPLRNLLPIIGEYGVSFIVVFMSGTLAALYLFFPIITQKRTDETTIKSILISLVMIICVWVIAFSFNNKSWTTAENPIVNVTLVQGNIPQQLKWDPAYMQASVNRYDELTQPHWNSQIVVWPEAAIPYLISESKNLLDGLTAQANQYHSALITGIPAQEGFSYYNALIVLGNGTGVYYKRHLVPFGEYLPLNNLLRGVINFFNLPMSDFTSGPDKHPLFVAAGLTFAPFICYEIAFTHLVLSELPQADVLITVSDDAWFGRSSALAQHLQMGQTRALETGRYLLFCSNTGLTAIINPNGTIQALATPFAATTITGTISKMSGVTPYVLMGTDLIIFVMAILFIIAAWFQSLRRNRDHG